MNENYVFIYITENIEILYKNKMISLRTSYSIFIPCFNIFYKFKYNEFQISKEYLCGLC